ncbi:MAG TPA: AAA family ATPase, partial [Chloroflexota bacterium]
MPGGCATLLRYNVRSPAAEQLLYLKTLDIAGFKSFARPARFEFPPGIAALVGPNGSGKSNVVDAIRWCLGEQSMRDLRGQRAEDVIYAGPRQILGRAEVSLTFSPSEGAPATGEEVTVSRRLFRSGESDYLIDGQKARLRDVLDALRGIGIDSSRHIVVTQGMADALLSASPAERRSLLEQAGGLGAYRARREEARQKLATTEQNIATIEAVFQELEPRLRVLRRQARAVQDRDEARTLLRSGLSDWFAARWSTLSSQLIELESEAARVADRRTAIEEDLGRMEREAEMSQQRERDWQRQVDMLAAAHHAVERDHQASERRCSEVELSLRSLQSQLASSQSRRERLDEARRNARERLNSVENLLQTYASKLHSVEGRIPGREVECGQAAARAERTRVVLEDHEAEATEVESASIGVTRRMEDLENIVKVSSERARDTDQLLASNRSDLERLRKEQTTVSDRMCQARARLQEGQRSLHIAEAAGTEMRARADRLDSLLSRIRSAANEGARRSEAVQRTLESYGRELHASLLDELVIQPGWDAAVSAALGRWAYAGVRDAKPVRLHPWEPAGFMEWRRELERSLGSLTWATHVVEGLRSDVSNPLSATIFVESNDEAAWIWNQARHLAAHLIGSPPLQVVTKAGERWDAVGVDSGSGSDMATEYLQLRREAEALRRRRVILDARVAAIGAARVRAIDTRAAQEEQIRRMSEHVRTIGRELNDLEREDQGLGYRIADLEKRLAAREAEMAVVLRENEAALLELSDLHVSVCQLRARAEELHRFVESETAEADIVHEMHKRLEAELRELRHERHLLAAKHQAQAELRNALVGESDRLGADVDTTTAERIELERQIRQAEADARELADQTTALAGIVRVHEDRSSQARAARPPGLTPMKELRETRLAASEIVGRHERMQAQVAHVRERLEELRREIRNELNVEAFELPVPPEHVPTDADIRRLRTRASQYADADESVIEEARELAERHAYLKAHVDDLQAAAGTLREMMRVADIEMWSRFDTAFRAVSDEFSRVFEVMLRGGQARLEQVDDGGIELLAQLPGKRSRSSAAFSGGERALVASSLLFGVLRIRP